MKKKVILAALALLAMAASTNAYAHDISAVSPSGHTLYYNVSGYSATVTYPGQYYGAGWRSEYNMPDGDLIIPYSIEYDGISYTVRSIGDDAFAYCNGLTSISLPDELTSIGSNAFKYCRNLTSITLPEGLIVIGAWAFDHCEAVSSVTIPNGVGSIGLNAFAEVRHIEYYGSATGAPWGAHAINGVTDGDLVYEDGTKTTITAYIGSGGDVIVPSGVTTIGNYAFQNCPGLTSITLPNGLTSIGNFAFCNCSGLTDITLPYGLNLIGNYAFQFCGITTIAIPHTVTSIGNSAFSYCSGLTSITIPDAVTSIGSYAFYECTGLSWISLGRGVTSGGNNIFGECPNVDSVYYNSNALLINYLLSDIKTSITKVSIGDNLTSIPQSAFSGFSNLASVAMGNGVASIGNYAFSDCSSLTSISIGSGVASIGNYAFNGCTSLTSVIIPDAVSSIGNNAFYECTGLTNISIGSGLTTLWSNAFSGCSNIDSVYYNSNAFSLSSLLSDIKTSITKVSIGDNVTSIPQNAFSECTNIASVSIGNGVTSIGEAAFSGCTGLTSITIPISVNTIGNYAFHECTSLTSISLSEGLYSIGNSAFYNCSSLTTIILPEGLASIGNYAFNGCTSLSSISLPATLTDIGGYAFYTCSSLNTITLPEGISTIGDYTFYGCSSLTSITLPEELTRIGHEAFSGCRNLISISLPEGLTSIGYGAFIDDTNLVVTIKTIVPPSTSSSLAGDSTLIIIVPKDAYDNYYYRSYHNGYFHYPYRSQRLYRDSITISTFCDSTNGEIIINGDTIIAYPDYIDNVTGLTAVPYYGYHFSKWSDDDTTNPRTITSISPVSLTAIFERNSYSISATPNTTIHGYVEKDGVDFNWYGDKTTAYYKDSLRIYATNNHGYHFSHWNDGNTDNPRYFRLLQDTQFVAYFDKNTYALTFQSNDANMGMVNATTVTGEYLDSTMQIYATAVPHYHFMRWNDYNTDNPRQFVIDDNRTYTAYFAIDMHNVDLLVDDIIRGTVAGAGSYEYGQTITVSATAYSGYHFSHWNYGSTENPYSIKIVQDTQLVASFEKNIYTLTFQSNDTTKGIVNTTTVTGEYLDTTMQIYATAMPHYHFVRWNDYNTDNPRQFVINDNRTYTAYFAIDVHTIELQVDNIAHGAVAGAGSREYGQPITVSATAYSGYQFSHWSDGSTYNPYTFAVVENKVLTAIFVADGQLLMDTIVLYDTAFIIMHDTAYLTIHDTAYVAVRDTTIVHDTTYMPYAVHDTTTVHDTTYVPYEVHDTITNTIHDTTVVYNTDTLWLHDTVYVYDTIYVGVNDVETISARIYTSGGQIVVDGAEGNNVYLYDVNGRVLATKQDDFSPLLFEVPASGAYLVKIGNHPARKVVVVR